MNKRRPPSELSKRVRAQTKDYTAVELKSFLFIAVQSLSGNKKINENAACFLAGLVAKDLPPITLFGLTRLEMFCLVQILEMQKPAVKYRRWKAMRKYTAKGGSSHIITLHV